MAHRARLYRSPVCEAHTSQQHSRVPASIQIQLQPCNCYAGSTRSPGGRPVTLRLFWVRLHGLACLPQPYQLAPHATPVFPPHTLTPVGFLSVLLLMAILVCCLVWQWPLHPAPHPKQPLSGRCGGQQGPLPGQIQQQGPAASKPGSSARLLRRRRGFGAQGGGKGGAD